MKDNLQCWNRDKTLIKRLTSSIDICEYVTNVGASGGMSERKNYLNSELLYTLEYIYIVQFHSKGHMFHHLHKLLDYRRYLWKMMMKSFRNNTVNRNNKNPCLWISFVMRFWSKEILVYLFFFRIGFYFFTIFCFDQTWWSLIFHFPHVELKFYRSDKVWKIIKMFKINLFMILISTLATQSSISINITQMFDQRTKLLEANANVFVGLHCRCLHSK